MVFFLMTKSLAKSRLKLLFTLTIAALVLLALTLYCWYPTSRIDLFSFRPLSKDNTSDNIHNNRTVIDSTSIPESRPESIIAKRSPHPLSHPKKREEVWADPYASEHTKEHMLIRRLGYVDDRFTDPFVALITMHNDKEKKLNYFATITYLSQKGGKKIEEEQQCVPLEYWLQDGSLNLKNNLPEIYVTYILRTKGFLLEGKIPHHVTVTEDCNKGRQSDQIRIFWNSKMVKKPIKYGVCLHKGLFNIKDPQRLVNWIEIHKALGIESITVYLEDVPETIADAIQPYIKEGLVNLLDWKLGIATRDYGQLGVITECHYINMYFVEYLGLYDLDEVIVPVKHMKWEGMFQELSKTDSNFNEYASFKFLGLRWHDGHHGDTFDWETLCPEVKFPIYFKRTIRDSEAHDLPKIIVRPLFILHCHWHGVGKWIKGKTSLKKVDQNTATSHHYRLHDKDNIYRTRSDSIMTRYKDSIFNGLKQYCNSSVSSKSRQTK